MKSKYVALLLVVVVLTGEMDPKLIQLAYQLGASSFLAKQASVEEFKNFVEFFHKFSRVANNLPPSNEDADGSDGDTDATRAA